MSLFRIKGLGGLYLNSGTIGNPLLRMYLFRSDQDYMTFTVEYLQIIQGPDLLGYIHCS